MRPKIQHVEFGNVKVDGEVYSDRDFFMTNNAIEPTEKSHNIGINDIEKMLLHEPQAVVISTGFGRMVKIDKRVYDEAKKAGVELYVLPTPEALKKYEELAKQGKRVVARIHVTC